MVGLWLFFLFLCLLKANRMRQFKSHAIMFIGVWEAQMSFQKWNWIPGFCKQLLSRNLKYTSSVITWFRAVPPESLLLTVSDLPEHWQRSPSLPQPTEVVVREVCCQVEMWSPERSLLWRNPCFQLDLYYLQEFKQSQDLDQCCPGKLFSVLNHWDTEFKVLPKKGPYADQPREQLPKWQPWVCIQTFVIPAGDLWGIRARFHMSSS